MMMLAIIGGEIGAMARNAAVPSGAVLSQAARASIGKRVVFGGGLIVLAIILWELRDTVPAWLAKNVTARAEFATTAERDDARVTRAFEAVRQTFSADATFESLPDPTRVRHTQLTVTAPTSDEAMALATRMSDALKNALARVEYVELRVVFGRGSTPVAYRATHR